MSYVRFVGMGRLVAMLPLLLSKSRWLIEPAMSRPHRQPTLCQWNNMNQKRFVVQYKLYDCEKPVIVWVKLYFRSISITPLKLNSSIYLQDVSEFVLVGLDFYLCSTTF